MLDEWLSGVLGLSCYDVTGIGQVENSGFYYWKLDSNCVASLADAQDYGFRVVDTQIHLVYNGVCNVTVDLGKVRDYEALDEQDVTYMSDFSHSRFHSDPLISNQDADKIKVEWIKQSIKENRGSKIRVYNSRLGFLIDRPTEEGQRLDLMGVANNARRLGVGKALVLDFIDRHSGKMIVSTQACNVAALNLYISCGFVVESTNFTLHLHKE